MTGEWTIELPEAWRSAPFRPGFVKVLGEVTLPRGRTALLVMALLKDGTNVLALTWDRGARLARTSPDTGWALEERFTGRPPGRGEGALIQVWKVGIDAVIKAGKEAQTDLANGWEPGPATWCITHQESLDAAYEAYTAREDVPPITREEFEYLAEVLAAGELEDGSGEVER